MAAGEPWSDKENDLIVSDYFEILTQELSGTRPVKVNYYRALHEKLPHRTVKSIEFKHQNITAVMLGLGQPWIEGLKPKPAFQLSLVDAVWRKLQSADPWLPKERVSSRKHAVEDAAALWIGPPPTFSNQPPLLDPERTAYVSSRFNVAERDAQNRELGEAGEAFILDYERFQLRQMNRKDLADRIVWTSKEEGDGAGYDIASFEPDGRQRLIEVKTTNGWDRTPFHITRNELRVADENRETWCLLRLHDFVRSPKAFEIRPPLERHVSLTPTSFLAQLQ